MAGSAEPAASCHHGYASWVIVANDGSSFLTSSHCAGTGCWVSGTTGTGGQDMREGAYHKGFIIIFLLVSVDRTKRLASSALTSSLLEIQYTGVSSLKTLAVHRPGKR